MKRLQVFALAAALTLMVFTGAFAVIGMSQGRLKSPALPVIAQVAPAGSPQRGDD